MSEKKCRECGEEQGLKQGWTNAMYCSYNCELSGVSRLHGSMPGSGRLPSPNWVPHHIGKEIERRWQES